MCLPFQLGERLNLLSNFKIVGKLTGSQFLEGVAGKEVGDLFQEGCSFYIENKLKSEIFNKNLLCL